MYIQKAEIKNIRSIIDFEIEFKNPAGWHVLIGDNGAGKSTIVRSMALVLVGNKFQGLRANWEDWLNKSQNIGDICLRIAKNNQVDISEYLNKSDISDNSEFMTDISVQNLKFVREKSEINPNILEVKPTLTRLPECKRISGWFSCAFGPYRRFEGGNSEWEEIYKIPSFANLAGHLSIFNESVALTEPIKWLTDLKYKTLENDTKSEYTLENLKTLINSGDFLSHNTKLKDVSSEGVFFKDGNGVVISVNQMSDGYRSILSMTFDLIRQLVSIYGAELVFKNIEKGEMFIDLPGVVLVDEIDAHLHPTWQTRIGQWFLKYFPSLQFIVTTHSPLVCRAAERGSIWRLAAPGSDEKSGEITGLDRERLIYGNVLDAYGTEVFGTNVTISEESVRKQEDLVKLSKKKMLDDISPEEEEKLQDLKKVFTTDAPIEL